MKRKKCHFFRIPLPKTDYTNEAISASLATMSRLQGKLEFNDQAADQAYGAVSAVLSSITDSQPVVPWTLDHCLEFEVLPPSIKPSDGALLVRDGRFVGIPKKALILAFLRAVKTFADRSQSTETLLTATAVILLHDPEHLSAVNWRKRTLLRFDSEDALPGKPAALAALRRELNLIDSILTSRLHRQTKSPMLWHHRLWLLTMSDLPGTILPVKLDMSPEERAAYEARIWRELEVVFNAGERHPCNYYAWGHARKIMERAMPPSSHTEAEDGSQPRLLRAVVERVQAWCLRHPGDTSGWSFLAWCMRHRCRSPADNDEVGQRVLDFARRLAWKRAALRCFLRTLAYTNDTPLGEETKQEIATWLEGTNLNTTKESLCI